MNPLRVGVVGVGRMGQRHCRIYSNLRRALLVGVHDPDPARAAEVARKADTFAFDSLDDLLDRVDAVSLAAPTAQHLELGMRCLERGLHVLIEKPIANTCAEGEELVRAAEERKVVLQVGHIERFNSAYIELKTVLSGVVPLACDLRRLSPFETSNQQIDVVRDLMIHDTNLAVDLMRAEPISVSAKGLRVCTDGIDHAVAQLIFPSGALFTITASRVTQQKVRALDVTAREAFYESDLLRKSVLVHRSTTGQYLKHSDHGVKYRQESVVERIEVPTYEPLFSEIEHFLSCILDGTTCIVSGRDGVSALRLAERILDTIEIARVGHGAGI